MFIETERYLRQMTLDNFGENGQLKLIQSKVLIIGCGGLGSPIIQYLAAAGLGELTLCDDDRIELTNLNRQLLFTPGDIGKYKAEQAAKVINTLNPAIKTTICTDRISHHNVRQMIAGHDCVVDCTDSLATKFLINDAAILEKCPLVHGTAMGYQGRFLVVTKNTACLRCIFTDKPILAQMPTCSSMGILGPICGIVGSMMATAVIKLLLNHLIESRYILINHLDIKQIAVQKDLNCLSCNNKKKHLNRSDYDLTT